MQQGIEAGRSDYSRTDPVIDACAFHEWRRTADLASYLSDGWQQLLMRRGDPHGNVELRAKRLFVNPRGAKLPSAEAGPATPAELLKRPVLASSACDEIVLGFDEGLDATAFSNHYVARAAASAANDWTLAEWLPADPRLRAMLLVTTALPEAAVAEIGRLGSDPRFVALAMGANALGKPFGHPIYRPIYEAASALNLPIVIQVGSDSHANLITPPVAGGLPATYAEASMLGAHSLMSHVASLIFQGVFDLFPSLKVLLVGGGAAWLPGFLWRLDYWYKVDAHEAPWLSALPSEYFRRHCRISTYSLERPRSANSLSRALATIPWMGDVLVYASGYPNWDSAEPEDIAPRIPRDWHRRVFHDNAAALFRWKGVAGRSHPAGRLPELVPDAPAAVEKASAGQRRSAQEVEA